MPKNCPLNIPEKRTTQYSPNITPHAAQRHEHGPEQRADRVHDPGRGKGGRKGEEGGGRGRKGEEGGGRARKGEEGGGGGRKGEETQGFMFSTKLISNLSAGTTKTGLAPRIFGPCPRILKPDSSWDLIRVFLAI